MKRVLFILTIIAILACPAIGARYRQFQVAIVDEFGNAVTNIDTVEIYDAGTSTTSTIYSTRAGVAQTNPMTTTSGGFTQSLGLVQWYQAAASFKITVTESGASQSLTVDNLTSEDVRFAWFVNYIGEAATLQVTDTTTLDIGTSDDFYHDWDNSNSRYIIAPATDGGRLDFGLAAVHTDIYWHSGAAITTDYVLFDEGAANVQFIDVDLLIDDEAKILIGDSSDVTIEYDESNNDLDITSTSALDLISFGATGDGYDLEWFSTTAGDYALFDYSADALLLEDLTLALGDGELLLFGDAIGTGTMSLSVATAKLSLLQVVADTGTFDIGVAGTDVPTVWHGETSGAEVTFTGDTVIVDGIDVTIQDADYLKFGDGDDWTATSATAKKLLWTPATGDGTDSFDIGANTAGGDLQLFGADTSGAYALWDSSNDAIWIDKADIAFSETDGLLFGDALGTGDFRIDATSAVLTIDVVAAGTGEVAVGNDADDVPWKWYAETTSDWVYFNADEVEFEDVVLQMMDDTEIQFGDDDDGTLTYDTTFENAMKWNGVAVYGMRLATEAITTTAHTITATETGKVFVSSYTGILTYTLPAAATGLYFTFIDGSSTAGNDVVIDVQTGDKIDGDTAGDAIESVTDSYPQVITLMASDDIQWHTISKVGTWGAQ